MSILKAPASERAAALEQYPDRAGMPTPLALELALSYAEAGRFEDLAHDDHPLWRGLALLELRRHAEAARTFDSKRYRE